VRQRIHDPLDSERAVVDACSNCHPAYTGTERPVASGSRIERFERRRQKAGSL